MAKDFVGLRLPGDLMKRIDDLAAMQEVTRTDVMERCLRLGIEEEEKFMAAMKNPIVGPLLATILKPSMARRIAQIVGEEVNPERLEALQRVRAKSKQKGKSTEGIKPKEA